MAAVCLVTRAVTNGLPSRSPPIQLPSRRNAGAAAAACPDAGPFSARSNDRYSAGTTRNRVSSNAVMAARTSSSGCIAWTRSADVRHSRSISSTSLRPASVGALARAELAVVQGGQQHADPPQRLGHRAPPRLCGMSGEDRMHAELRNGAIELLGAMLVARSEE